MKQVLLLHGSRQTGALLLGRVDKWRRRLSKLLQLELVAPIDGVRPHPDSVKDPEHAGHLRMWYERHSNDRDQYIGLEESLQQIYQEWMRPLGEANSTDNAYEGMMGFSQGATMVHWIATAQEQFACFPGLQWIILVAGCDVDSDDSLLPNGWHDMWMRILPAADRQRQQPVRPTPLQNSTPSLHVYGMSDRIIAATRSQALARRYRNPTTVEHDGGHHVPMQAAYVQAYIDFVQLYTTSSVTNNRYMHQQKQDLHSLGANKSTINSSKRQPSKRGGKGYDTRPRPSTLSEPNDGGRADTSDAGIPPPANTSSRSFSPSPPLSALKSSPWTGIAAPIIQQPTSPPPQPVTSEPNPTAGSTALAQPVLLPDNETWQMQLDELDVLQAVYPDELQVRSSSSSSITNSPTALLEYQITLPINEEEDEVCNPIATYIHRMTLQFTYPHNYPLIVPPLMQVKLEPRWVDGEQENGHAATTSTPVAQLPMPARASLCLDLQHVCLQAMQEAAKLEEGMPCVLSCVQAARDVLESNPDTAAALLKSYLHRERMEDQDKHNQDEDAADDDEQEQLLSNLVIQKVSPERIHESNQQGLQIAEKILCGQQQQLSKPAAIPPNNSNSLVGGSGGAWSFVIGLVGKPSAGKSTFFNAATAFARQRGSNNSSEPNSRKVDDTNHNFGGAAMAAHPFTTIDPNVGYCLTPAPEGSCPEDDVADSEWDLATIGSTHGRDSRGRRLMPVLLKDVAGLVPGAYQGRGRGNQFLNDLTDADVLIHVVDASGTADASGNVVGTVLPPPASDHAATVSSSLSRPPSLDLAESDLLGASSPLEDLAWIRNELIEWVYANLMHKWPIIRRRGRSKLSDMFSGYGQTQAVTQMILQAVETYLQESQHRDRALDHLVTWDEGDVHLLVSAFLGVRFPMVLALNKADLPTSANHIQAVQAALPIHGALASVPLSARKEMSFLRRHIQASMGLKPIKQKNIEECIPEGVWECLQSALTLRQPVWVFPVTDFTTYAPLPGMAKNASEDPSLPSGGMIECLLAAGGSAPTMWNPTLNNYQPVQKHASKKTSSATRVVALRDALLMKPGSTVEDAYIALKRLGALGGEFVRAEAACHLGESPKPLPKAQLITKQVRIIRFMTSKRTAWQNRS